MSKRAVENKKAKKDLFKPVRGRSKSPNALNHSKEEVESEEVNYVIQKQQKF